MIYPPQKRITCGIIEKAALHRALTKFYIARLPELELVWECEFQETVRAHFDACIPDLLFLQIRHVPFVIDPSIHAVLTQHKGIVITTGFTLYDVAPLPVEPLDFLQKPFSFELFEACIAKHKRLCNVD